ncbi:hypothetical protein EMIHUDRAFT_111465 [Emiliania huxleyi CCMP1516]|uniref:tRNA (cytosine(38)-C(5))-methyltransferase n=2 Tax=Emiliania huxleyi TaxID=2903 RepID=A0A0D3KDT7_EMIH1|nr:hypothetical protein EMIHUDRAFT_111465 [Emiliania huxleyi CCMP1516]EOD33922.1 hypothetical protein EMIHUDRAFT_111465 [Emiliania huxleyi CCMP1516]|eukprot:XP_005786351.1 hypothetical protein EMIHUDRAFT_111465 [Emiliania huxleyi CCMP1516]
MADWSLALAHRAEPHGGLPVGAVLVQPHSAERLRKLLLSACGARLPLETHRLGPSPHRRLDSGLMVHCPPPIATLFEAAIAGEAPLCTSLAEFVSRAPVVYLSGVRRHERVLGRAPPAARGLPAAPPPPFTFAEVFAGIGGFRLGLEPLGGVCSLACEVDPMACATYRLNFARDGALLEADLTGLPADELPAFDLLAAGFPCQTFSVRGEQRGVESTPTDWRGGLYLELAFLFENVPGLVTLGGGGRSAAVSGKPTTFRAGSVLRGMVAAFEGLPQYRERLFLAGVRRDCEARPMDWSGLCYEGGQPRGTCLGRVSDASPAHASDAAELTEAQLSVVMAQLEARGECLADRAIPTEGKAPTLISLYQKTGGFSTKLMGFPESYSIPPRKQGAGYSGFYRQIGNAVCPPVVAAVGERLLVAAGVRAADET